MYDDYIFKGHTIKKKSFILNEIRANKFTSFYFILYTIDACIRLSYSPHSASRFLISLLSSSRESPLLYNSLSLSFNPILRCLALMYISSFLMCLTPPCVLRSFLSFSFDSTLYRSLFFLAYTHTHTHIR